MASFSDLSPYLYCHHARRAGTVNIGWIDLSPDDPAASFPSLPVHFDLESSEPLPAEFIEKLWQFCACSCVHYRGFHLCNLGECAKKREFVMPQATCNGRTISVGCSEIRVFGKRGIIYAAPTLIFHYITAHGYRPPMAFIDAVLHGPQPGTKGYFLRMKDLGLDYWRLRANGKYKMTCFDEPSFWQRCWIRAQNGARRLLERRG